MKLFKILSVILMALAGVSESRAQEAPGITGNLYDEQEKVIPFATVAVVELPDSTVVTGTTTDFDGKFELDPPAPGKYLLRLSAIGFEPLFTDVFEVNSPDFSRDFGNLVLPTAVNMLNEVMVEAWRPRVELEAGKMVVRVAGTAMAAGSTAFEIVSKSPGVTVDQNGELSINGKAGVQVLINGRETYLSEEDLKNMLETMPAENIENIEIINSPSAKYPAAGTAGLINVILKDDVEIGFSGSIYGGAEFNNENWYNAGASLSYGKGKWSTFLNLDVTKTGFDRNQEAIRRFIEEGEFDYYHQTGEQLEKRWKPSLRAGVDYLIDEGHSIGFVASHAFYEEDGFWNTVTELGDDVEGDLVNIIAKNSSVEDYANTRLNLHYIGELDSLGTVISADFDYVKLERDRNSYFDNYYTYFEDDSEVVEHLFNKSISSYDIIAGKVDLELPLSERSALAMGVKGSKVVSESDLKFYIGENQDGVLDTKRTNDFRYEEEIYAAYLSYTNKFNETWNLQAGLRAEQTVGMGYSPTTGQKKEVEYLDFFPNVQVNQVVTEDYEIGYSYSRRIKRPDYSVLNPFYFYLDPYTYIVGNPDLEASITSSYKMTHNLFDKYQLIMFYDYTDGPIGEYPQLDEETGHTIFTRANLDKRVVYGGTLVFPVQFGSFWNMNNTIVVNKTEYQIAYQDELVENDQVSYTFQSNNQFNLPWDMIFELNAAYYGPEVVDIYQLESRWFLDAALKKSFIDDRLDVTLKAEDVFGGLQFDVTGEYPGSTFRMNQHFYDRGVSINLRYKLNPGGKEREETRQENLEELNRAGG